MERLKYKEKIRRDWLRKKVEKEKRFENINEIKRNWMRNWWYIGCPKNNEHLN